jgi:RNA polymerase sigma factor (sigma-70 family)
MNNLTREEFARFLTELDSDRRLAAEKYELLRRKLVKIFERQQCLHTEELADETMDRVAKKAGNRDIRDLSLFAYGVARNICLEAQRRKSRYISLQDHNQSEESFTGDADPEERILTDLDDAQNRECLTQCLGSLPLAYRELIIKYYQGEKQVRIKERRDLARSRGITIETLRCQANGVRDKLRSCVNRCLNRGGKANSARQTISLLAGKDGRSGE